MKKLTTQKKNIKLSAVLFAIALTGLVINACNKSADTKRTADVSRQQAAAKSLPLILSKPSGKSDPIVSVVTIARIGTNATTNVTKVLFNQNEEIFTVSDAGVIATLKNAFNNNRAVQITFDPYQAVVSQASIAPEDYQSYLATRSVNINTGTTLKIDAATTEEAINHAANIGVLNSTTSGLNGVIPDLATAQLIFDYISHQCCALPGPYAVDYCITFQYVEDGCYARASKMCEIINSKYHYATQKLFSFAFYGNDELCVQANKWNGCCINWWYHVAPLVTINTSQGPKAYIMDPAMFDQPMPAATWLHFQENPACDQGSYVPLVDVISIQPNSSYQPNSSPYSFVTDPGDVDADATLVNYRSLISCP